MLERKAEKRCTSDSVKSDEENRGRKAFCGVVRGNLIARVTTQGSMKGTNGRGVYRSCIRMDCGKCGKIGTRRTLTKQRVRHPEIQERPSRNGVGVERSRERLFGFWRILSRDLENARPGNEKGGAVLFGSDGGRREREQEMRAAGRLPPGQSLTLKWPILQYGSVPRFDPRRWDFQIFGLVERTVKLSWRSLGGCRRSR